MTYTSSSSSSFGIGIGNASPPAALLPSQNLPPGLRNYGASSNYETSFPTTPTTTSSTTRAAHNELIGKEEQKAKVLTSVAPLLILLMLALLLILPFVGGSDGKSSWSIWIPLGLVSIGYGSEGFQWGIWWFW